MSEPVILLDTREQAPFHLNGLRLAGWTVARCKLATGDYSIAGFEGLLTIERKSHADAWKSVLGDRNRFRREWERMGAIVDAGGIAVVLIDCSEEELAVAPRGKGSRSNSGKGAGVVGTYRSWSERYKVPVIMAATREDAERAVEEVLRKAHELLTRARDDAKKQSGRPF